MGDSVSGEREAEAVIAQLLADAELTEKALDFMSDPEQIEEAEQDIALWREAASALSEARRELAAKDEALRIAGGDFLRIRDRIETGAYGVAASIAYDGWYRTAIAAPGFDDAALAGSSTTETEPTMGCGHPLSAVVTDNDLGSDGTSYCGMCAGTEPT
jgi:hypothetical protein